MGLREKLRKWCPHPETPFTTKLKRHSVHKVLTATALMVSVSLAFFIFLFHPQTIPVPPIEPQVAPPTSASTSTPASASSPLPSSTPSPTPSPTSTATPLPTQSPTPQRAAIPWPPTPDKTPPTLTIQAPQNSTTLTTGTTALEFTVTPPNSWNQTGMFGFPVIGQIAFIEVYIDDNFYFRYEGYIGNTTTHYSLPLNRLTLGSHCINVTVFASAYYNSNYPYDPTKGANTYPIFVSNTIYFTVTAAPLPSSTFPKPDHIIPSTTWGI